MVILPVTAPLSPPDAAGVGLSHPMPAPVPPMDGADSSANNGTYVLGPTLAYRWLLIPVTIPLVLSFSPYMCGPFCLRFCFRFTSRTSFDGALVTQLYLYFLFLTWLSLFPTGRVLSAAPLPAVAFAAAPTGVHPPIAANTSTGAAVSDQLLAALTGNGPLAEAGLGAGDMFTLLLFNQRVQDALAYLTQQQAQKDATRMKTALVRFEYVLVIECVFLFLADVIIIRQAHPFKIRLCAYCFVLSAEWGSLCIHGAPVFDEIIAGVSIGSVGCCWHGANFVALVVAPSVIIVVIVVVLVVLAAIVALSDIAGANIVWCWCGVARLHRWACAHACARRGDGTVDLSRGTTPRDPDNGGKCASRTWPGAFRVVRVGEWQDDIAGKQVFAPRHCYSRPEL